VKQFAATIGMVFLAGCYTLQPVGTTPPVGSRFAVEITDAGRVALGGSMGPAIDKIEGRLVEPENGEFVIAVTQVRMLRGVHQVWTGEHVRVKKEYVGRTFERRLHKGRTIAFTTALVGGALAVAASQNLFGLGSFTSGRPPIDTGDTFRPIGGPYRGLRFNLPRSN
jgi:hypothetical protein